MTISITQRALVAGIASVGAANAGAVAAGPKGVLPTIAMLARSPVVEHICLSPDATRFAYVTRQGDQKFIVINEIATEKTGKTILLHQAAATTTITASVVEGSTP